ncbi:conserved hypothetical protein [Sulfurovum sp. NBC37-1]|nr:conserved hypothetical protein [Sulfurovum sp. NBC37-1]
MIMGIVKKTVQIIGICLLFSAALLAGKITPAAERPELYLPLLKGKKVALVVNHSSLAGGIHLVDYLLKHGIKVKKIFVPEHGFRGTADAGAHLGNSRDRSTGLPIVSLYGKHKKPTRKDLKGIDLILFDIQDVGVRFYTYLSTLHYVMEAGAEQRIEVMVLDRPNPNGHYIDGPVLKKKYRSFVGLDPVPVVYGMTIGEYARMLNGERWLKHGVQANLTVIPLKNYTHGSFYSLPVKPSPNLPNDRAVMLYPSLAFFEGTVISAGRGSAKPFQLYGAPKYRVKKFSFVPRSRPGARYPKYKGKRCYGVDLSRVDMGKERRRKRLNLSYLRDAYTKYIDKKHFFLRNGFFDRLAGTDQLREQIISGASEAAIRKSWEKDLRKFRKVRAKYLLYP